MLCEKCGKQIDAAAICPYCGQTQSIALQTGNSEEMPEGAVEQNNKKGKQKNWVSYMFAIISMVSSFFSIVILAGHFSSFVRGFVIGAIFRKSSWWSICYVCCLILSVAVAVVGIVYNIFDMWHKANKRGNIISIVCGCLAVLLFLYVICFFT